jgi:hypothetical protein
MGSLKPLAKDLEGVLWAMNVVYELIPRGLAHSHVTICKEIH